MPLSVHVCTAVNMHNQTYIYVHMIILIMYTLCTLYYVVWKGVCGRRLVPLISPLSVSESDVGHAFLF